MRIRLSAEVNMPQPKKPRKAPAEKKPARGKPGMSPERAKLVERMVEELRRARRERADPTATFEQESDTAFEIMRDVLLKDEEARLRESVTTAEEVDVDGKKFSRLEQASSATYFGRFGAHHIEEALYREVGVHNGPTIKPIELRVGVVERMLPDMARVVGRLTADHNSRALDRTLVAVGYVPPSRAFLQDHVTRIGAEVADAAAELEQAARDDEAPPRGVASVSCGLDRMAVRMSEIVEGEPRTRAEPYERAPPPPSEQRYRMAWVGSTTAYDTKGDELGTWRCATEADADPADLADRVAEDVAWLLDVNPHARVHCVQDAAPELSALPEALARALPADVEVVELVDFEHVARYLDNVIDACDPADTHDMKSWYRSVLLDDDSGIDRIQHNLRRQGQRLPVDDDSAAARKAIAAALSYMRPRKDKMRYASHYRQNLPIGSGATESTCWQMQQRVKLPGQSWVPMGLRGVLAIRALVLSARWDSAWRHYAAFHRAEVSISP